MSGLGERTVERRVLDTNGHHCVWPTIYAHIEMVEAL